MEIRSINAMRGPNYWSVRRHKLIVMVLDLEEMEELPSNKVDGFPERLKVMFPSMFSHRCSEGCEGGFFMRVDEGTWMGPKRPRAALAKTVTPSIKPAVKLTQKNLIKPLNFFGLLFFFALFFPFIAIILCLFQ